LGFVDYDDISYPSEPMVVHSHLNWIWER